MEEGRVDKNMRASTDAMSKVFEQPDVLGHVLSLAADKEFLFFGGVRAGAATPPDLEVGPCIDDMSRLAISDPELLQLSTPAVAFAVLKIIQTELPPGLPPPPEWEAWLDWVSALAIPEDFQDAVETLRDTLQQLDFPPRRLPPK